MFCFRVASEALGFCDPLSSLSVTVNTVFVAGY